MDAMEYATEYVPEGSGGWRVKRIAEGGTAGWIRSDQDKFRAWVEANGKWTAIWTGNGLRTAVEQVIWYDRAMNQEAE